MTLEVRLSPEATRDRERLAEFLVDANPEAAARASETIISAVSGLARFPFKGRVTGSNRRELSIAFGNAGYIVQYRVEADAIVVARIFHMREDR